LSRGGQPDVTTCASLVDFARQKRRLGHVHRGSDPATSSAASDKQRAKFLVAKLGLEFRVSPVT
jgi:hypothetical protein